MSSFLVGKLQTKRPGGLMIRLVFLVGKMFTGFVFWFRIIDQCKLVIL